MKENRPIGIFDSGIGGLTVAKALVDALPNESVIYFGDTAHLPYGDKSISAIQGYVKQIVEFLLSKDAKLILIACNSASAAAYEMLEEYIDGKALLINVIDPVVKFMGENYQGRHVGLIGTKLTVGSNVYANKLAKINSKVNLSALETPLLASMIEEGFSEYHLLDITLAEYLTNHELNGIEALVLGCTHYPLIKDRIMNFYENKIDIIDAAKIVADSVKAELTNQNLLSNNSSSRDFYVSDYTEYFSRRAQMFFGEEVLVKALNIF